MSGPGIARVVSRRLATIPAGDAAVTPRRVDPSTEPATLEAMDGVMQRAYGASSFRASIDRFVAAQPDGLAVVETDGRVVATGCCIAYPSGGFGWVGLVATEPGFERRGLATAVTAHLSDVLAAHGCAPVLDASVAGAPVYERIGFLDHGVTTVMGLPEGVEVPIAGGEACELLTIDDLDDVVAFDSERFGGARPELIAKLLEQHPQRAFAVRRGGSIAGYLVAQEATLAPVIADDDDALCALMSKINGLRFTAPPRINLPPEGAHLASLTALGFEQRRQLRHMRRGIGSLPGRRASIAGMVSLGEG